MDRSRRKSFFLANERIKRCNDIQSSQSSQSTIDTETHRNTLQNRRQSQSRNTRNRNTNAASQSTNSDVPNSQLSDVNETQHRTRAKKITQRRGTVATTQSTIAEEPKLNNNVQNQRVTRTKIAQRRNTVSETQSTIPDAPKQRGRPARRQNRLNGIDEPASNENEIGASAPAKVTRRRGTNIASQSAAVPDVPNGPKQRGRPRKQSTAIDEHASNENEAIAEAPAKVTRRRGTNIVSQSADVPNDPPKRARPARRQKRLTAIDEQEINKNDDNQRRTRSRSKQQSGAVPALVAIVDEPEINNNDENQRQTRSKSAQRREAAIAAQQARTSISPKQKVNDKSKAIASGKNKRQKDHAMKATASKIQNRRNTIAVNDRELNDVINYEPHVRGITILLDRLNSETFNKYRDATQPILWNSQAAKKIINRRCTVNLDRIEFPDDENHHSEIVQSQPLPLRAVSSNLSLLQSKSVGPSVDSGLPVDRAESSFVEHREHTGDTTFYESDEHEMSSDISVQDKTVSQPSQPLFTHAQVSNVFGNIEHSDAMNVDSDGSFHRAVPGVGASAKISTPFDDDDADDEDDPNDDASTYCPSLPPPTPINITQLLLSQTSKYYSWNFNRSSTNNSINTMAVNFDADAEPTAQSNTSGVQSTPNKCFIDSPHVSYGEFIEYGNEKFAVNCLEHSDQNIRHHFLNKFSSDHIHALNTYFHGNLWVTEITGNGSM